MDRTRIAQQLETLQSLAAFINQNLDRLTDEELDELSGVFRQVASLDAAAHTLAEKISPEPAPGDLASPPLTGPTESPADLTCLLNENRRQGALLDAIFAADPSGIAVLVGTDLSFALVNPAYRYITPDPTKDLIGRPYAEIWPDKSPHANRDRLLKVIRTGHPFQVSGVEYSFPDGSRRIFTLQARRIEWDGQPAVLIILWDTTEQRQADDERRKLLLAVEESPETIVITDPRGIIEYVNPKFCELTGFSAEEAIGQNPRILKSGYTSSKEYGDLWQTIRAGKIWRGEFCNRKRNGELYWESASISPVMNDAGEITHFLAVKQDITEKKRILADLQESQDRLLLTAEAAGVGTWCLDRETGSLYCDDLVKAMLHLPADAPPDLAAITACIAPEDRPPLEKMVRRVLRDHSRLELEFRIAAEDGCERWLYVRGQEQPGRWMGVVMDVTQRKRAQADIQAGLAQIEVQRRLLEQREQERLQIARDLHDGPVQELLAVMYALHGLASPDENPDLAGKVKEIRFTLQKQVAELRSFAGELRPPALSKFGLVKAIRSHLEGYEQKHPQIAVDLQDDLDGYRLSQDVRLALFRIYQETLNNIARHARATRIEIRLSKDDRQVLLEIQDDGVGFELPHDWLELARRGHLGLVGIRERAEAIGGRVEVQSQPGHGSLVRVSAPI
jgi:PAS domain S-box-containing protein